jgi:hypothetical protein
MKRIKNTSDVYESQQKFMDSVAMCPMSGCWIWLGAESSEGYGRIGYKKRVIYVHRWSYELFCSPIPTGMQIDHKCHNRICVNPDHLRLASHTENNRNTSTRSHNKYGFKGVCRKRNKWQARFGKKSLGVFDTPELAHEAYLKESKNIYGEFAYRGYL